MDEGGPRRATWGLKESDAAERVRTHTRYFRNNHGVELQFTFAHSWASSVVRSYRWQRKASCKNELII